MTAERRLAKLEGALSPKAATLLWLEEAQQFRSLPAYVAWLIDQPISASPLERVPAQARTAVVEAMRGQPREAVREAAHGAVRDGLFLVELVLRLNSVAEETIRMEGPRYAIFFWEMRALSAETTLAWRNRSRVARSTSSLAEHWQACARAAPGSSPGSTPPRRHGRSWSAATSMSIPRCSPRQLRTGRGCSSRPSDWSAWAMRSDP
jgi:hypothetical protein